MMMGSVHLHLELELWKIQKNIKLLYQEYVKLCILELHANYRAESRSMMKVGNILLLFPKDGHGIMPDGIARLSEEEYGFENELRKVRAITKMLICSMTITLPYIQ